MQKPWRSEESNCRRFRNLRRRLPARFDEFKEWLAQPPKTAQFIFNRQYWNSTPGGRKGHPIKDHAARIFESQRDPIAIWVEQDIVELADTVWPNEIVGVQLLGLTVPVVREDINIRELRTTARAPLTLRRCFIDHLNIEDPARLTLDDCYIRRLSFGGYGFNDLSIRGGVLLHVDGKAANLGGESPFKGRITIDGLYLPRSMDEVKDDHDDHDLAKLIYEYRNVRTYLASKNDNLAAGVFHGAELALERKHDRWPSAFVSWLYEIMSDFGNSTVRPLGVIALLLVAMATFSYLTGGVVPTEEAELKGWQKSLAGTDPENRAFQSLVYAIQTVFNPLGLLSAKPLLIATEPWQSVPLTVLGLVGTFSVALLVLALRRRFKLE